MDDNLKAYRDPKDYHLFRSPSDDPAITPDVVTPSVEGYFTPPIVWIGDAPSAESGRDFCPSIHFETVVAKTLSSNVHVWALRDGTFLFDFTEWPLAPTITVPGYRNPDPGNWKVKVPGCHTQAEEKAKEYAVIRAQLMNVHQLCLIVSTKLLRRCSFNSWHPVTAHNTIKSCGFSQPPLHPNYNDPYSVLRIAAGCGFGLAEQFKNERFSIEIDVVEKSFDLLDEVLKRADRKTVVVLEAIYLAGCRTFEGRYGEALVLAWGVCEQMISLIWDSHLSGKDNELSNNNHRISASRRKKLLGRDYTASVMIEVLELDEKIDHDIYQDLEIARKARNKWMHEMTLPNFSEISACIRVAQRLVFQVWKLDMPTYIPTGPQSGPGWYVWAWESQRNRPAPAIAEK